MAVRGKRAESAKPKAKSKPPTDLTDDNMRALATNHVDKFERLLATKKKADADFRNGCKLIKAELGDDGVAVVKAMIDLSTPEGEAKVKARIATQAKAAKWKGLPLGAQIELSLGEPDRTPSVDKAFDAGKMASMNNEPRKPPHDPSVPQYEAWLNGYAAHQEILAGKIGRGNDDDKDVRPKFLKDREAERDADKKPEPVH